MRPGRPQNDVFAFPGDLFFNDYKDSRMAAGSKRCSGAESIYASTRLF